MKKMKLLKILKKFNENISNKSFFENEKFIIISRATDKIFKIVEEIVEKNIDDTSILLISEVLEKNQN